jgi:hypothetical protein
MDVSTQGVGLGIGFDPYADASGVAAHHPDNRRTVIGIGAAPTTLVRSAARWVSRVKDGVGEPWKSALSSSILKFKNCTVMRFWEVRQHHRQGAVFLFPPF